MQQTNADLAEACCAGDASSAATLREPPRSRSSAPPALAIAQKHILIVDEHPPIREWARATLAPHRIDVTPADGGDEALALLERGARFDGAICEVLMPHAAVEGIAVARALWHDYGVPCLILTSVEEPASRLAAFYAGAMGYVLKRIAESDVLVRSVMTLLKGRRLHDPLTAFAVSAVEARQIAEIRAAYLRAMTQLTPHQRVVAGLILEGKTNQEIAEQLVLSRGTVNSHVSNILQRLNLATRRDVRSRVRLGDQVAPSERLLRQRERGAHER